ncbi:MAG: multiheme c-type cytochrome [Nannocystaceae bacterium]
MVRAVLASPLLVLVACADVVAGAEAARSRGAIDRGDEGPVDGRDLELAARDEAIAASAPRVDPSALPPASATMPGPHRGRSAPARLAANEACVACHPQAALEWSRSLHRSAFVDPDFAGAYAREPTRFCRGCHAAEADPGAREPGPAAAIGVACVTCHRPEGGSLAADAVLAAVDPRDRDRDRDDDDDDGVDDEDDDDRGAPHPIVRDPDFTRAAACAGCHDFDHPDAPGVPMQSTAREHRAASAAAIGCPRCHMRGGDPERAVDHGFAASRDPGRLRAALAIDAERPAEGRVLVRLRPRALGHAFPTGDMFRRVLVEASAVDEAGDTIAEDRRILGKTYEDRRAGDTQGRVLVADDRIPADDAVTVELDLDGAAGASVRWRVVYQRIDQSRPTGPARRRGEVVLAEGTLPAAPSKRSLDHVLSNTSL